MSAEQARHLTLALARRHLAARVQEREDTEQRLHDAQTAVERARGVERACMAYVQALEQDLQRCPANAHAGPAAEG